MGRARLQRKVAVVTGASAGRTVASRFARENALVTMCDDGLTAVLNETSKRKLLCH
jgi:NAD(P)-dependent dehydrogenase (short-subunit alcohol dehydrogenase family)